MATRWHLITGEYPPAPGGVSDYSRTVARGLAQSGDEVHVWAPGIAPAETPETGISVHRLPDRFGLSSIAMLKRGIDARPSSRILVQYVPHAFGWKAMNVPFCTWLWSRRRRNPIDVMFHEVAFPIARSQPLIHNALGVVNRAMAAVVARSADRIFVSTTSWEPLLRPTISADRVIRCVPIPSGVEVVRDPSSASAIRRELATANGLMVGHFGTFSPLVADPLGAAITEVSRQREQVTFLLIGRNSGAFRERLVNAHPALADRIHATGELAADKLSNHLSACDLMIQPYPDGISTRRTTAMAALAHRVALVTTAGDLTERFWSEAAVVAMAPAGDSAALAREAIRLLDDEHERKRIAAAGLEYYSAKFDAVLTITALRSLPTPQAVAANAPQYSDERSV